MRSCIKSQLGNNTLVSIFKLYSFWALGFSLELELLAGAPHAGIYLNAGTGNGMAKSLLDAAGERCSASNAILSIICGNYETLFVIYPFQIVRCPPSSSFFSNFFPPPPLFPCFHAGHKQPLDVSTVKQGDNMFFSVLMLTWGTMLVPVENGRGREFG